MKRVFTNDLWLGQKKGKVARCRAWISFPSRSDLVGVRIGMTFCGVLHSVRMVLLRLGDVSGWCAE